MNYKLSVISESKIEGVVSELQSLGLAVERINKDKLTIRGWGNFTYSEYGVLKEAVKIKGVLSLEYGTYV